MFDIKIEPENSLELTFSQYTCNDVRTITDKRSFDSMKDLKAYVFGSTVCLVDNHFQAFFNMLTHNRDYLYSRCKNNREKLSYEDYDYTLEFGKVVLLKDEIYDPAASIYRRSRLVDLNINFLYSIPQRMKTKGAETRNILNDLHKESKLILRNIRI